MTLSSVAHAKPGDDARESSRFRIVLIKPSHYDDDGYVIRWRWSTMPSNSLASVYGLIRDAVARDVLAGREVILDAIDETNTRVRIDKIIRDFKADGNRGFVGLVGVQSNQYPRALDIARPLRAAGIQVALGGFHPSGLLSMFPGVMPDVQSALDMGISIYAGEAEGRIDDFLHDAAAGQLKPIYNYIQDLPNLEDSIVPFLPHDHVKWTIGNMTSFDAGRGCPFQCSFCTIINVQGRKSRRRSPDDIERILRQNAEQGVNRYFITDDNFARNKDWEIIFDRIIKLREEEGMDVGFMIQVDTLCHKIPRFIEKAKRAGVSRIFIGLENINPDNLLAAKKRQNKITEYRKMLLAWKAVGIWTYAGYITGFPNDTAESVRRDIEIVKRELPLDILEFFFLTPLPGSEDHKVLHTKGVAMDPDLNKYDLEHAVTAHPKMSQQEWEKLYWDAWKIYYTPEHVETIFKRARISGIKVNRLMVIVLWFAFSLAIEKVHPLQGGILRLRARHERRSSLPRENPLVFYPQFWWSVLSKNTRILWRAFQYWRICKRVQNDPKGMEYTDIAMTPVEDDDTENLEMFTHTDAAKDAVVHIKKVHDLTHIQAAE